MLWLGKKTKLKTKFQRILSSNELHISRHKSLLPSISNKYSYLKERKKKINYEKVDQNVRLKHSLKEEDEGK